MSEQRASFRTTSRRANLVAKLQLPEQARERAEADIEILRSLLSKCGRVAATAAAIGIIGASTIVPAFADIPTTKPDALIFDEAELILRGNEKLFTKAMNNIQTTQGYTVRFAMVKGLPFGETPDEYAKELAEQWKLSDTDVLFVASPKLARAGVFVGDKAGQRLTKEIAQSIANETFAVGAGEERYGAAVLDVSNRLIPVLSGEEDPGAPKTKLNEVVQNYKTKKETKSERGKYITVVVTVLVISVVAPLIQTFWYVRDD